MAVTAAKSPTSGTNDSFTGQIAWVNPGNITSSDNVYATATRVGMDDTSYLLSGSAYGFTTADIPSGSTIDGIEVSVERKGSTVNRVYDERIQIYTAAQGYSSDRSTATPWPTTDTVATYGGPTDLWGLTPTDTDIRDASFAALVRCFLLNIGDIGSVDHVLVTVYYTPGSANISGSADVSFTPSGALKGSGRLAGATTIDFTPVGVLRGAGRLVGDTTIVFTPTASFQITVNIAGASSVTFDPVGVLGATVNITGSSDLAFTLSADGKALSGMVGATTIDFSVSGTMGAFAAIAGSSTVAFTPTGDLTGFGALSGAAALTFDVEGEGQSTVSIYGSTTITFAPTGALSGSGALMGQADIIFTVSGPIFVPPNYVVRLGRVNSMINVPGTSTTAFVKGAGNGMVNVPGRRE